MIDSLSNLSVRIPEFIQKGQQAGNFDLTIAVLCFTIRPNNFLPKKRNFIMLAKDNFQVFVTFYWYYQSTIIVFDLIILPFVLHFEAMSKNCLGLVPVFIVKCGWMDKKPCKCNCAEKQKDNPSVLAFTLPDYHLEHNGKLCPTNVLMSWWESAWQRW